MIQQPNALRLAHALNNSAPFADDHINHEAAAELRRFYAVNVELVDALEAAVAYFDAPGEGCFSDASLAKARAALAAAKE
jgi:hypothetical protein